MRDFNLERGQAIADLLGLKFKKNARVDTLIGDKTRIGLALTIERLLNDDKFVMEILKK